MKKISRCSWVNLNNPLYVKYHDEEWSVPVHDDQKLFEFIVLESAQAGLSWEIILKKREGYRKAFRQFDPQRIAKFNDVDFERLMINPEIVRNKLKIRATVTNALAFLKIQKEFGSFSQYLWDFKKTFNTTSPMTQLSEIISKDMKQRGFKFFGPTTCYAFLQAVGLVNDHSKKCFLSTTDNS